MSTQKQNLVNLLFPSSSSIRFQLRQLIDTASEQRLASAFILSRVDYCNAVLVGLATSTLAPLQRVLNDAARFVAGVTSRTHVSDIIKSLHWLPIAYRIRFKLCVLMHSVHSGTSPSYLTDTTTPISSLPGHRQLRSAMTTEYGIARTRTQFGDSFLCCWTAREECSSRRYKEHYRLVILQTSHQDTLFLYWHIWIKQFSRLYYVRRFWTIFRGIRSAI